MTLKGGTSQACAACKFQRKRCTSECLLAPHFRPEQTEIFKNAHKLFGVKNILQTLKQINPDQKNEAMRSIIYEANMRERFPVHGCLTIIVELHNLIEQANKELYVVQSQLEFYRQQQRRQQQQEICSLSPMDSPESQNLQSCNHPGLTLFQKEGIDTTTTHNINQQYVVPVNALPISSYQSSYTNNTGNENNENENENIAYNNNYAIHIDSKGKLDMDNVMWGDQQTYCNENENNSVDNNGKDLVSIQSQMVNTQPLLNVIQDEVAHDYDEIYPVFDTIDDTQSYIDSKETNESSSESSMQHVAGNKLNNAELQFGIVINDYHAFA